MASKKDLESEVKHIREEIADKSTDPKQVDADLASLQEELDRVVDERDALRTKNKELTKQLKDSQKGLEQMTAAFDQSKDTVEVLQRELSVSKDFREQKDESVVLGGIEHRIVHRDSVKELMIAFRRNEVEEDALALIVKKKES